jgi:hypothetical protein
VSKNYVKNLNPFQTLPENKKKQSVRKPKFFDTLDVIGQKRYFDQLKKEKG